MKSLIKSLFFLFITVSVLYTSFFIISNSSTAIATTPIPTSSPTLIPTPREVITPIPTPTPSELQLFAASLRNDNPDQVVGVYVPGVLALQVIQQPWNNSTFVENKNGSVVTQFSAAKKTDVIGLLAHNYLSSGASFYNLQINDDVSIVYGDGKVDTYRLTEMKIYQKLEPYSLTSDLIDLGSGRRITTSQAYHKFYETPGQVVFQTCIEENNNLSWGLFFIVGQKIEEEPFG
jgi:hypothetical protein